jgi:hypothetical protein
VLPDRHRTGAWSRRHPCYPPGMNLEEIPLDQVDDDDMYRISDELDSAPLEASLRETGQLNPALLVATGDARFRIVTGYRRVAALRRIGIRRLLGRRLPAGAESITLFRTAVWDNLAHRQLTPLENARILTTLEQVCRVPREAVVTAWLPVLGLPAHRNVLHSYLALHQLAPGLKTLLRQGRITTQSAERLSAMPHHSQERVARVLTRVQLSASLQRKALELVGEIAAMDHCSLAGVLERPDILGCAEDPNLSAFQRGERMYQRLYELRNPRLSRARARFASNKERLGLPGDVRVLPDAHFETTRIRVEFDASSPDEFRRISSAIDFAARSAALDALFEVE